MRVSAQWKRFLRKRRTGLLPPTTRFLLSQYGNVPITSLQVVRTPLASTTTKLLQYVSLGTYDYAVRLADYDKMFHLALVINNQLCLDKQEVIKLRPTNCIHRNSDVMNVKLNNPNLTVNELIERTRLFMGNAAFSNYNALHNNCQDFVTAVLQANNLLTDSLFTFVKQDAAAVFRNMPSFTERLARFFTDAGATANRLLEGESVMRTRAWGAKRPA